jgi:probable addiction module antidote protein
MRKFRKFKDIHLNLLKNPKDSKAYLEIALEAYEKDGNKEAFLLALRDVAEAQGGLTKLAERTHLNRQNLYKVLSKQGNPSLDTVGNILHGLGFRFAIVLLRNASHH